jgi:hypothetical protein
MPASRGKVRNVCLAPQACGVPRRGQRGCRTAAATWHVGGAVLLFQVNGRRDHLVVIGGPGTHIADLKAGEFGFRD